MEALDILEKRIDSLTRIIGPVADINPAITSENDHKTTIPENIVDSLLSASSIMNEAISGREQIKSVLNRTNELEKYLDPSFLEESQQVRIKEVYLNAISYDLRTQCAQLEKIKELEYTLGAEYFRNIPGEALNKLKEINKDNAEFAQQADLMEESLILTMKRYGEIQTGLLESLDSMNKRLELIQERLEQKKREEMEKDLPEASG